MPFRLAGGWVRDKLLQKPSHDIDVAVQHATGVQAAEWVRAQPNIPVSSLGIVAANPDQSKHLETAVLKLFHVLDVDFVPLRCAEVYSDPLSRIPQETKPGTPYQDAMRRDFTLNALFFNVQTQCIEDWTGRGIVDLRRGMLVTPLDPAITLKDDPLRLLRGLRFAVRYSFALDPALQTVAQQPYMRQLLQTKVSRERIGKECMGMWQANAVVALVKLYEWKLASVIFQLPVGNMRMVVKHSSSTESQSTAVSEAMLDAAWFMTNHYLQTFANITHLTPLLTQSEYYHKLWTPVAAFLLPFRHFTCLEEKQKSSLAVAYMLRNSIKAKNVDVQCMTNLFDSLESALELLLENSNHDNTPLDRLKAGRFVKAAKPNWVSCLYLAATVWCTTKDSITTESCATTLTRLIQAIHDANLHEAWSIVPLLSGKEMMQALQLKPGPMIGEYQQRQLEFLYQYPHGTVEECLAYLQESVKRPKQGE